MQWKYPRLVAGMASLAACSAQGAVARPQAGPAPGNPTVAVPRTECARVAASTSQGMYQYVAIVAPSRDEILRLDLLHTEGLSLADHPATDQLADGRVSVGSFATDAAIATLCGRGCTHDRNCDILVITSKEQLLTRWKQLQCDVEPEPGTARDPGCEKP
jgi:hypothetical protein